MKKKLKTELNENFIIILENLIVGMCAGLVIVAFRKAIFFFSFWITNLYSNILFVHPYYLFIILPLIIGISFFVGILIKTYPVIESSGISQLKGNFLQKVPFLPWPELPLKFITGLLCIGSGLSIGRAGPAIQLGAYFGSIFERIGRTSSKEKICLVTGGATAGLSAIFGAPFASVLFAIEGLHQYLNPLLLICIITGAFSGKFMASIFFGSKPIFDFSSLTVFPTKYLAWLVLFGLVIGLVSYVFRNSIIFFKKNFIKILKDKKYYPIIPFIITVFVFLFFPLASGGGDELIATLIDSNFSLSLLLIILIVKIVFTGLCLGSGSVGGVFFPALACGALVGAIFAKSLVYLNFIESSLYPNFLVFGMSAFLACVINAPITGILLLAEISGEFYNLDGIIVTCLVAYIVINFIDSELNTKIFS